MGAHARPPLASGCGEHLAECEAHLEVGDVDAAGGGVGWLDGARVAFDVTARPVPAEVVERQAAVPPQRLAQPADVPARVRVIDADARCSAAAHPGTRRDGRVHRDQTPPVEQPLHLTVATAGRFLRHQRICGAPAQIGKRRGSR